MSWASRSWLHAARTTWMARTKPGHDGERIHLAPNLVAPNRSFSTRRFLYERRERKGIPDTPVVAVIGAHPHRVGAARVPAAHIDLGKVGGRDIEDTVRRLLP